MKKFIPFLIVAVLSATIGASLALALNPSGMKLSEAFEHALFEANIIDAPYGSPVLDSNGDPVIDPESLQADRTLAALATLQYYYAGGKLMEASQTLVSDPATAETLMFEAGLALTENP